MFSQVSLISFIASHIQLKHKQIDLLETRKVVGTLSVLLNYTFFVDLKYKEAVLDLKDKLIEVEALKSEKYELRKHIEEMMIKEENNVKDVRSLEAKIPRQMAKVSEMEVKEKALKIEATRIEAEIEKFEMNFIEIRSEVENLKSLAVTDQEVESILASKGSIAKQLEEQDQITIAGRQKLEQNSQSIEQALAITNKMEALFASTDIDADEIKYKKEQLDKIKAEVNVMQSNIVKIQGNIEAYTQKLQLKTGSVKQLIKKRDAVKNADNSHDTEQRKEMKELENLLRKLSAHEAALAATHQRLKDEQQLLYKFATNVIKHISTKNFEE